MVVLAYETEIKRLENIYETICGRRRVAHGLLPTKGLSTPCQEEPCWETCPWNPQGPPAKTNLYEELSNEVG